MVKRIHLSSNPVVTMVPLKIPQLNDEWNAETMVNVQGFIVFVCKLHIFQYNCIFFLSHIVSVVHPQDRQAHGPSWATGA